MDPACQRFAWEQIWIRCAEERHPRLQRGTYSRCALSRTQRRVFNSSRHGIKCKASTLRCAPPPCCPLAFATAMHSANPSVVGARASCGPWPRSVRRSRCAPPAAMRYPDVPKLRVVFRVEVLDALPACPVLFVSCVCAPLLRHNLYDSWTKPLRFLDHYSLTPLSLSRYSCALGCWPHQPCACVCIGAAIFHCRYYLPMNNNI